MKNNLTEDGHLIKDHKTICPNCNKRTTANNVEYLGDEVFECNVCREVKR